MSFDITNDYLKNRLKLLGYAESEQPFTFDNVSESEHGKTFILYPESGALEDVGENLSLKFYDSQLWSIKIAMPKSEMNDVINRNVLYRRIEEIIKDLDNPDNWLSTLRYLRYQEWSMEELESYYLLTIKVVVQDTVTY